MQAAPLNEALFMALLFSMIRLPDRFATRISGRSNCDAGGGAAGAALFEKKGTLQRRTRA